MGKSKTKAATAPAEGAATPATLTSPPKITAAALTSAFKGKEQYKVGDIAAALSKAAGPAASGTAPDTPAAPDAKRVKVKAKKLAPAATTAESVQLAAAFAAKPHLEPPAAQHSTTVVRRAARAPAEDVDMEQKANPKRKREREAITMAAATEPTKADEGDDGDADDDDDGLSRTQRAKARRLDPNSDERLSRTIFIGNVALTTTNKTIRSVVNRAIREDRKLSENEPSPVESVRFRSLPIAGTAVTEGSNHRTMIKACAIQGKFAENAACKHAYVVLRTEDLVDSALKLNGTVIDQQHVRVDRAASSRLDYKRTVFVGNLPFEVKDETVWALFAEVVEGGSEAIKSVRVVRDRVTNKGKGIAYVMFKQRTAVAAALKLNGKVVDTQTIRVTRCDPPEEKKQAWAAKRNSKVNIRASHANTIKKQVATKVKTKRAKSTDRKIKRTAKWAALDQKGKL